MRTRGAGPTYCDESTGDRERSADRDTTTALQHCGLPLRDAWWYASALCNGPMGERGDTRSLKRDAGFAA